jgi:recombination protein RecR
MTPVFEELLKNLKQLPGLGYRSAEKIALHLLVEKPDRMQRLVDSLQQAGSEIRRCASCGNLAEEEYCPICLDESRDTSVICVIEQVPDLVTMERSATYRGLYHVLHGKLSPVNGIGPEELNINSIGERAANENVQEIILALPNDIEGEATCHYMQQRLLEGRDVKVSRIGFGIPSGGGVTYADPVTLRSAMEGRTNYD